MKINPEKDLNSSPVGKDLLEKLNENNLEKDLNSSPIGEDLLEK